MARRCGPDGNCGPRTNWWKESMDIDWYSNSGLVPPEEPVNYFLRIHGQSNAAGRTTVASLPLSLQREFQNVYIWVESSQTFEKLQAGVNNNTAADLIYYGPEISLADLFETNHPNDTLYISKYAIGSSSISTAETPNWNSATVGSLLDTAIDDYDLPSAAAIPGSYTDLGMLWVQGERDAALSTAAANAYKQNTIDTFAEIRTRLGASLRIIGVRIRTSAAATANGKTVRSAQTQNPGQLYDKATYPNNLYFTTGDRYDDLDSVHWLMIPFGINLYYEVLFPLEAPVTTYHTLVEEYINVLNELSYTVPSTTVLSALSQLATTIDFWHRIDAIWIFGLSDAAIVGSRNICFNFPRMYEQGVNGSMDYDVSGYKGTTNAWLDPVFIQTADGPNYQVDDACRFCWVYTAPVSVTLLDGRSATSGDSFRAQNSAAHRINQGATDLDSAVDLSGTGYTAIDADAPNSCKLFKGTTKFIRTRTSSTLPNTRQLVFRSGSNYGDMRLAVYGLGGSLTDSQHNTLKSAIQTYLTAIGL